MVYLLINQPRNETEIEYISLLLHIFEACTAVLYMEHRGAVG